MRYSGVSPVLHARWGFLVTALLGSLGCWGKASSRHAAEPSSSPGSDGSAVEGSGAQPGADPTPLSPASLAIQSELELQFPRETPALAAVLGMLNGVCFYGMDWSPNDVADYAQLARLIESGDIVPGSGGSS